MTDTHGPIDFVLLEFTGGHDLSSTAAALMDLIGRGIVSLYDLVAIRKEDDGTFTVVELDALGRALDRLIVAVALLAEAGRLDGAADGLGLAVACGSGSLGKRLLLRVADVMRTDDAIPAVGGDVPLTDGLMEMTQKGLGMTAIVEAGGRVAGLFTDGDLRRTLE